MKSSLIGSGIVMDGHGGPYGFAPGGLVYFAVRGGYFSFQGIREEMRRIDDFYRTTWILS